MMITINLLSPKKKLILERQRIYLIIKNIVAIILIFASSASIILTIAKTILEKNFKEITNQVNLIAKDSQSLNQNIKIFNNNLELIDKIQKEFLPYSQILTELNQIIPPGIVIDSLNLEKNKSTNGLLIKIKGRAELRENFLEFKNKLEAKSQFSQIEYPIANLLEKENVNFELSFNLNYENSN